MKIICIAPAKINLMLHVVGRLTDGYHHLQSLVTFGDIGDQVIVEKADRSRLTINGPFAADVPLDSENSIVVAARWLKERFSGIGQAHLHLTKNLPVFSGIGGGSSDAAAAIAGLLECFEISLSGQDKEALILASGELGADVPMCLAHQFGWGPLLWIDGSGREILPVPVKASLAGVLILANPGVPVSTPTIFKEIQPPYTPSQSFQNVLRNEFQGNIVDYLKAQKNDLMEPAMAQEPNIGKLIQVLQGAPGCYFARMSGSGATCFALFEDEESAKSALVEQMPVTWCYVKCL